MRTKVSILAKVSLDRAGVLIAVGLLSLHVILAVIGMQFNSPTQDEPAHIARGYHYVVTGELSLDVQPPLMNALSALPLLLRRGMIIPPADPLHGFSVTDFADKFIWIYNDGQAIVNSARLMTVLVSAALGYTVFCWARLLWGTPAGLLALFVYILDPNILAHSQLATTNLGVTAFVFMASFFLWRFLRWRRNTDLLLSGVLLGLAQAVTLSALILIPIFVVAVLCEVLLISDGAGLWPWHQRIALGRRTQAILFCCAILAVVLGLAFVSLWASYRFETAPLMSQSVRAFVDRLVGHPLLRDAVENHSVPLYSYVRALRRIQRLAESTTPAYLAGRYSSDGWWYYVPVAIALKTPLPTLILLAAGALLTLRGAAPAQALGRRRGLRQREYILALPVLGFLLAGILFHSLHLGYRHVLPVLPFVCVLCGKVISWPPRRAGRVALAALALWYVAGTTRIYPHCLAYFNEFAGGSDNGSRYLVGSDLDWGQDLNNLKTYMDQRGIDRIHLAYYGSAHAGYYGIQVQPWPAGETLESTAPAGWYAISATYLRSGRPEDSQAFGWLRQHTPVDTVGYSIFVYRLE